MIATKVTKPEPSPERPRTPSKTPSKTPPKSPPKIRPKTPPKSPPKTPNKSPPKTPSSKPTPSSTKSPSFTPKSSSLKSPSSTPKSQASTSRAPVSGRSRVTQGQQPPARKFIVSAAVPAEPEPRVHYHQPRRRRRRRWGICHPAIAIPVVGVLTLLLRVHPMVVCGILLLNPYGNVHTGGRHWVVIYGPPVIFTHAFFLIIFVTLLFVAVWKESTALVLPYIVGQLLALGIWCTLTIYAIASEDRSSVGLIIITGIGAVFDLWSMITALAAYLDVRGYRKDSDRVDSEPPPARPAAKPILEPPLARMARASGITQRPTHEARPPSRWRLDLDPKEGRVVAAGRPKKFPEKTQPQLRRRYMPQTTGATDESRTKSKTVNKKLIKKPGLSAVSEH